MRYQAMSCTHFLSMKTGAGSLGVLSEQQTLEV